MKKILIPLVVLALIGGGIGFYMYNKPVESLKQKKADVTISADQLNKDYESDEQSADAKYLGKVVEVNGIVAEVTTEEGTNKISLQTSNPISFVICELNKGCNISDIKNGDQVKIKGLCSGYLGDVHLEQAFVSK